MDKCKIKNLRFSFIFSLHEKAQKMIIDTEKGKIVESIVDKFASLLALATPEEVKNLDNTLAKVMPALSTSVQKFNVGCKIDENFAQINISFAINSIKKETENTKIIDKLTLLVTQLSNDDLDLLNEIINAFSEVKAQKIKIHLSPFPVMEIAPQTWIVHFHLKTIL